MESLPRREEREVAGAGSGRSMYENGTDIF
jgi:hypothetical protein